MIRTFQGVRVFTLNTHRLNPGSAITIPGIGIFLGLKQINNKDLLRHEFGHIIYLRFTSCSYQDFNLYVYSRLFLIIFGQSVVE